VSALDQLVAYARVLSSVLLGDSSEPVYNLSAIGDFDADADADPNKGEQAVEQLGHAPLGFIWRPLDPDDDGFAEAITLRIDGGLQPFGWRDLRINALLNPGGSGATPAKGQQLFANYGGGFLSHSLTAAASGARKATISVLYCPHDFNGAGVPSKAHAIIVDPTSGNSNLTLVHSSGCRVTLAEDTGSGPGILLSVNGQTFLRLVDGELSVSAEKILLKGNVYLGAQAELGVLFTGGPSMLPSPSVFLSPT
jgi:hypothetical protein